MRIRIVVVAGAALLVAGWAGADERSSLQAIGEGRALYLVNCASCHGTDARGLSGPNLTAISARDGVFDRRHVANPSRVAVTASRAIRCRPGASRWSARGRRAAAPPP